LNTTLPLEPVCRILKLMVSLSDLGMNDWMVARMAALPLTGFIGML